MTADTGCRDCRDLLGGYVLGALEPAEARVVARHLAGCPSCAAVHGELAGIPALLEVVGADVAPPAPTPADLESRVLSRVAAAARTEQRAAERPDPGGRRRWHRRTGLALASGLAGAALAFGVVALTGGFATGPDSPGPPSYVAALRGPGGSRGEARLRPAASGTTVRLRVDRIAGTPGVAYELWCVLDDGRWISAGTFRVPPGAATTASLTTAARLGEYGRLVVTRRVGKRPAGRYGPAVMQGEITL